MTALTGQRCAQCGKAASDVYHNVHPEGTSALPFHPFRTLCDWCGAGPAACICNPAKPRSVDTVNQIAAAPLQGTTTPAPTCSTCGRERFDPDAGICSNPMHLTDAQQLVHAEQRFAELRATLATQARTLELATKVARLAQHGTHCDPSIFGAPCNCGLTALRRALTTEPTP